MPNDIRDNPLSPALESVCQLLEQEDVHGMIIGGLAASLLGRPRFTNDIDLIILGLDDRIPEFILKLKSFGIEPLHNAPLILRISRQSLRGIRI